MLQLICNTFLVSSSKESRAAAVMLFMVWLASSVVDFSYDTWHVLV